MSPTYKASTPCLHVSTPVYGNNTSSPVTMHLRYPWPLIYCCWNERAQAFPSTLWPSDYGNNTHSANTRWNLNFQMILTTVPYDRRKSCCSTVCNSSVFWGLNFPHFHVWCVNCCVSAISLTIICTDMLFQNAHTIMPLLANSSHSSHKLQPADNEFLLMLHPLHSQNVLPGPRAWTFVPVKSPSLTDGHHMWNAKW